MTVWNLYRLFPTMNGNATVNLFLSLTNRNKPFKDCFKTEGTIKSSDLHSIEVSSRLYSLILRGWVND